MAPDPKNPDLQGEGNYDASRRYRAGLEKSVERLGHEAEEALEGDEGDELREAEEKGKRGEIPSSRR